MLTKIKVQDETTFSLGKPENVLNVFVNGETITVRELIRSRIFQEVETYNQQLPKSFHLFVQPNDAKRKLNGYQMKKPRLIDSQAQYELALQAFENNGFLILAGDWQVGGLEDEIRLHPGTEVTFLKLAPIFGG
jgi:hypothetical protein